jgi:hypothetical protein
MPKLSMTERRAQTVIQHVREHLEMLPVLASRGADTLEEMLRSPQGRMVQIQGWIDSLEQMCKERGCRVPDAFASFGITEPGAVHHTPQERGELKKLTKQLRRLNGR